MKIIIIDDNQIDLTLISKIIEETFEIKTINFSSSREAYRWIRSNDVDIVILDCLMPSPNGIEFVYLLRSIKHYSDIPIIMVTASEEKEIKYQAFEMGVNFYIQKPIDKVEFFVILNNAISMRQNQKRIQEKERELEESEEKFRVLTEKLPNMVIIFKNGKAVYANEILEKTLGITKDELYTLSLEELIQQYIAQESIQDIKEVIDKIIHDEEIPTKEYSLLSHDKKVINTLMSFCRFFYGGQKATLCIATDISEQKKAELAIRESQRRLSTLVNNLPGIAYRCRNDINWTMEYISEGCFEITGYKADDLIDNKTISYGDLIVKEHQEMVWKEVQKAILKYEPYVLEYRINTKDKKEKWVWEKGTGVYDDAKNLIALEGFITDITERKEAEQKFKFMAHYDALTGLANRTLFFDRLNHTIKMAKRGMYMLALIYIDLDGFKFINDTYGHDVGDQVLKETANRLMECVRESDTLARIGGDEFTVILSKIENKKSATIVANKILRAVANPYKIDGITCNISASLGISFYYTGDEDADMLIKKADIA
ncbi:MAG: diguanylate cyclase, partial [Thermodesulfovibrionales bacterium]|nr:diguanylate cyclase [Thermodesulfovibrionales bacterium]